MHIAIDLDEVLSETVAHMLKFHGHQFNGIEIHREQIDRYKFWEMPHLQATQQQAYKYFNDFFYSEAKKDTPTVQGAYEKIEARKQAHHTITVVTARLSELKKPTIDRLENNFNGLIDDLYFADHYGPNHKEKSEICHHIGAEIMIEDNLEYAQELAENGIPTFLLEKPRNAHYHPDKHHNDITKVLTWEEITIE